MHVLVVHQYFLDKDHAGGSRWNQFAKYWTQAGHKVTILAGTLCNREKRLWSREGLARERGNVAGLVPGCGSIYSAKI